MARLPREINESPYYHVLIRGNGERKIFLEDEDKDEILAIFKKYSNTECFKLIAYCILDSHAHFLLKVDKYDLSSIMKKVNVTYAYYYNNKYQRSGHVFYDRFQSTCIEDKKYILPVIRFIHNDPLSCGFAKKHDAYKWSSYREYIEFNEDNLIHYKQNILNEFDTNIVEATKKFKEYTRAQNEDLFLDVKDRKELKINRILEFYLKQNNIKLSELGYKQNKIHRIYLVLKLKDKGKLSIRQIGEVLHLNRGVVYNIIKEHYKEEE